jgi:hypothetical protein
MGMRLRLQGYCFTDDKVVCQHKTSPGVDQHTWLCGDEEPPLLPGLVHQDPERRLVILGPNGS